MKPERIAIAALDEPPFNGKQWITDPDNALAVEELTGFSPEEIRAIKILIKPAYRSMNPPKPGRRVRMGLWEAMSFGLCQITGNFDQRQIAAMFPRTPNGAGAARPVEVLRSICGTIPGPNIGTPVRSIIRECR